MKNFPHIKHLNDVYDAIDIKCFYLIQKEGYQVINYMFSSPEAFPDITEKHAREKREFRGLIFDLEGNIIRRPYHKFFNVGERLESHLENIDVSKPHIILEKLDGSMIVPFPVSGDLIWGTKMGKTEVSDQVVEWLKKSNNLLNYSEFVWSCVDLDLSPIFEWTSNSQRIVLDYPEPKLVLTAVRHLYTGDYLTYDEMRELLEEWNIPLVRDLKGDGAQLSEKLIEHCRTLQDAEGFVIRFDNGQMYKIKSDWYCQLHRVKSEINYERGVITLLLNGNMDDLKSLMPANDLSRIEAYEKSFHHMMVTKAALLAQLIQSIRIDGLTRKDYALGLMPSHEKWMANIIFKTWDMTDDILADSAWELLKDYILSNCNRNSKFDEMRANTSLFKNVPAWRPVMFTDE